MPLQTALRSTFALLLATLLGGQAGAITLTSQDDFESGLEGWGSGANHPQPPVVLADGGPTGLGDAFLRLVSQGGSGAGSRLVAFAGSDWGGDYAAAGVGSITMDLNNQGATDLSLRLSFTGSAGSFALTQAVLLPAHSGWTPVLFSLSAADLLGDRPAQALGSAQPFRLIHAVGNSGVADPIAATLGVDNIAAAGPVPEPGSAALLAVGLAALLALRARLRAGRAVAPARRHGLARH